MVQLGLEGQPKCLPQEGKIAIMQSMTGPGVVSANDARGRLRFEWLRTVAGHVSRIFFPPLCGLCGEHVHTTAGICAACWPNLTFIENPLCNRMGTPFAFDPGAGILSTAALARPPVWNRVRGAVEYNDPARTLVHALKYRDHLHTAKLMGRLMARAGAELIDDADFMVPVPLYRLRLWQRRFNQSALLAQQVQDICGLPTKPSVLIRARPTRTQVGLDLADRKKNVRNAFSVPDHYRMEIEDRKCLLIDDVMTTGATAEACTRALLEAGAQRVDVIVFALVLSPSGRHI